ncbi:MAG: hypothetical protein M1815_005400 [Lichina confinis]|nr:MAG: hypothetical protein M1815_005400 [Lichina confinis]
MGEETPIKAAEAEAVAPDAVPAGDNSKENLEQEPKTEVAPSSVDQGTREDSADNSKSEQPAAETNGAPQATPDVATEASKGGDAAKPQSDEKTQSHADEAPGTTKSDEKSTPKKEDSAAGDPNSSGSRRGSSSRGRGGARGNLHRTAKRNIKFDPSKLQVTRDPDEIRKQVEFYFSDSNLPADKFLLGQVGGTANNSVKIKLLHSFKRMRRFQPFEAVVAALKESKMLEVIDDESVRRKVPLTKEAMGTTAKEGKKIIEDKTLPRSVYAKGFGDETPTTQFEIEAFFAQYGPTNALRLRRTTTGLFKSSVFVEFSNEEAQQAFLALEPKPKWKGNDLLIKSKNDYVQGKIADIEAGRIRPSGNKGYKNKPPRRSGADSPKKGTDPDDWKKRRDDDQKRGFKDDRRGRGRGQGRGGRDRGRGGRGGAQGRGDPHKVPTIKATQPDGSEKAEKQSSQPAAAETSSKADPADAKTSDSQQEAPACATEPASAPAPAPSAGPAKGESEPTQKADSVAPGAPAAAVADAKDAGAHMDMDPLAGKKRAREDHDDGTKADGGAASPSAAKKIDIKGGSDKVEEA